MLTGHRQLSRSVANFGWQSKFVFFKQVLGQLPSALSQEFPETGGCRVPIPIPLETLKGPKKKLQDEIRYGGLACIDRCPSCSW